MRGTTHLPRAGAVLAALAMAGTTLPARADLSYTEKIRFNDVGGLGKSEITRHVALSGLKEREEILSKIADARGYPAGVTETSEVRIVRLDKDAIWTLDPNAASYTAMTIEQARARQLLQVQRAPVDQMREAPDADVHLAMKKQNLNKDVGPFRAEEVVLAISTQEQDARTGEKRPTRLLCDLWVAQGVPGQGELRSFSQTYMDKLHATSGMAGMKLMAASFPISFGRAFEAIKGIPGTPVEWTWTVERALSSAEAADLKQDVIIQEEGGEDELQVQAREGAYDSNQPRNLQTPSPDAPTKKPSRDEAARGGSEAAAEIAGVSGEPPQGIRVMMKVTTMLDKIEATPITAATFEIPAGYTAVQADE